MILRAGFGDVDDLRLSATPIAARHRSAAEEAAAALQEGASGVGPF